MCLERMRKGKEEQRGTEERDISRGRKDVDEVVGSGSLREDSSEIRTKRRVDHKTSSSLSLSLSSLPVLS